VSGPQPADALIDELIALPHGELRLLRPRDSEALLDERAFSEDEFLPYWAEMWPSGLALARQLSGRALRGARVVELGCGLGLPSLVAAAGGGRVLATDWSQDALDLLRRNARLNEVRLRTERVEWGSAEGLVAEGPFDLVLAADVCYERRNVALLLSLLPRLGQEVWLADPGRSFTEAFLDQAPRLWSVHSARAHGANIHRLTPRPARGGRG
jgi:predicted nicotinamide N-methyase